MNVVDDAAAVLLGPVLPAFTARYSDVEVNLCVDDRMVDVTGQGFDAGVRYGGIVPAEMVAQRLSSTPAPGG